jgi:hypothetical protein
MVIQIRRIGCLDADVLEALVEIAGAARELIGLDEMHGEPPALQTLALRTALHRLVEIGRELAEARAGL